MIQIHSSRLVFPENQIIENIYLPQIKNEYNLYITEAKEKSLYVTKIKYNNLMELEIKNKRSTHTEENWATIMETNAPGTSKGYLKAIEEAGFTPAMSLDHILYIIDNHTQNLNTTEKTDNGTYTSNLFFMPQDEHDRQNRVWVGEIVVVEVTRRPDKQNLEFEMVFHKKDDPRTWTGRNRKIIV